MTAKTVDEERTLKTLSLLYPEIDGFQRWSMREPQTHSHIWNGRIIIDHKIVFVLHFLPEEWEGFLDTCPDMWHPDSIVEATVRATAETDQHTYALDTFQRIEDALESHIRNTLGSPWSDCYDRYFAEKQETNA